MITIEHAAEKRWLDLIDALLTRPYDLLDVKAGLSDISRSQFLLEHVPVLHYHVSRLHR